MMACYDLAKPLAREAVLCSGVLIQYRDYIPENERGQAAIFTALMYTSYFMHCFNRQYFDLYGSQNLETVQRTLFPSIAIAFNKQFDSNVVSDDRFYKTYNETEQILGVCGHLRSSDGSFKFLDQDSALSVFSNGLCQSVFGQQQPSPVIIATIAKAAEDGAERINFQPKLIELGRWYAVETRPEQTIARRSETGASPTTLEREDAPKISSGSPVATGKVAPTLDAKPAIKSLLTCPACNQKLRVPAQQLLDIRCPKCQNTFRQFT